ncbi:MAG TPA: nuclear transport factor 2 family protein [Gemmatimonadales bacterium]
MTFTRRLLVAGAALTSACASSPQAGSDPAAAPPSAEALTAELQRVFDRSARDWNAGDLDGFMADYANESTTSYVSRGAVRYGYDTIRGVYAGRFAPGAQRDSLRFENLAARPLGATHALVTARFILHRGDSTTASGPFSVVMERRADGWKILHDHTSTD